MRQNIRNLLFGRDSRVSGAMALTIVLLVALGCTCGKGLDLGNTSSSSNSNSGSSSNSIFGSSTSDNDSGVPDDNLIKALVKSTTADFASAIENEDFSTLYANASDDFKHTYTEDQMKDYFKDFITKKKQVVPILAKAISTDPDFTSKPSLRTEAGTDILVVNGKYATKPVPVTIDYEYVKRGGEWKLLVLKIFLM
ncbi:MAG TPA: hypothetical protein VGJ02_03800 [Pyrinomonadaceae bacterium]